MAKAVFCIATTFLQAEEIVDKLKNAGFASTDISVLFPDTHGAKDLAHEKHTKAPEGAVTGAGAGGVLGGALGWLVGIGAVALPGIGPFVAAGPIMAALGGVAVGATVGGLTGGLVGMGIPEYEAKLYEGKMKEGKILISVHSENPDTTDCAKTIFKDENAEDIAISDEAAVKS
ncbi:MAG: membrane protein [Nitrospirales bacterium]|nr:MAG: membrane protein [Nitrospirales bacterium]